MLVNDTLFLPVLRHSTLKVPNDATIPDRKLHHQAGTSLNPLSAGIRKSESTPLSRQHRNISEASL